LLSFGGASYAEGGIPSADLARSTADKIWAMFGPPQDGYKEAGYRFLRPFGYASVDGFDFDVEAANQNLGVFGNRLKWNMDQYTNTAPVGAGRGRKFYLTAAPQCPFPEKYNADVLANVPLDAVFVQFFNNECGGTFPVVFLTSFH
jgi:chitinase